MISGLVIPFAIETERQNTVRIPQRNLVMTTGDDVTLRLSAMTRTVVSSISAAVP